MSKLDDFPLQSARRANAPASCHLHPNPIDIAWVEQMRSFQVVAAAMNHAAEHAQLRELLGLSESASAKVEASRYLSKWSQKDDGFLEKHTERGRPYYTLR